MTNNTRVEKTVAYEKVVARLMMHDLRQKALQYNKLIRFLTNTAIWGLIVSLAMIFGYDEHLAFHASSELFTVIIAFSAFIIVLNTYSISQNDYLAFLGIAFGFVSAFEMLHLLIFTGIDVFGLHNQSINMLVSIIPRLMQGLSIIAAFLFLKRKLNITLCITAYFFISTAIFSYLYLRQEAIEGYLQRIDSVLLFSIIELAAAVVFGIGLIILLLNRRNFKHRLYKYMLLTLVASISSDILLATAADMDSSLSVAAHILKFIAFFCLYKAIIQNTLKNPMDMMFFELNHVKNELAEKNDEISKTNEKLTHDIEDLHLVEKLLRKSKAWSRSIFEGSPVGIALLNTNGLVIEANPALERILGYSGNELRNIGISNITHIDDIESDSRLFDDLIESIIDSYEIEKRYIRKDGVIIWANVKMSYIQNVGEDFQFIIAMIEDISQQKENEERQLQLVTRLEETNKELDNFAYIVSHDLKAPLRGIGSLANWLVTDYKDKLDKEGADIINLLVNRVERMKNFIDGILQYSRVTRVKDNFVNIDLNRLVREVIDMLAPPANIEVVVECELPSVRGERIYIEQVFLNLISNAVKFMDKDKGVVRIDCRDNEEFWEFSIADNGSGIDEKYFNKIFMIFQTLQPRDKFESTGVGLSIVKKIIETSGGKIWLESKLKKGTTFYFTLPKKP